MAASQIGYLLSGIAPTKDPLWQFVGEGGRRAFWERAAEVGLDIKDASLRRGLDKNGRPMRRIHPLTVMARRANINPVTGRGPYSPQGRAIPSEAPLQATGGLSRTVVLLRYEVRRDGVWYYWGVDAHTGLDWGVVLQRHAQGFRKHFKYPPPGGWGYVPSRDVIGLSRQDVAKIRVVMDRWWRANRDFMAAAAPLIKQKPSPKTTKAPAPQPVPVAKLGSAIGLDLRKAVFSEGTAKSVRDMAKAGRFSGFRRDFGPRPSIFSGR